MTWPDVRTWGATPAEQRMEFPCDRYLPAHDDALFRAVAVAAPAALLFHWLCQLRVAPYSYDWIDNFGRRSPRRLLAGLDDLAVGQKVMTLFDLVAFERPRHLTLRTRASRIFGQYAVTYMILPVAAQHSRLVVKLLVALPRCAPPSFAIRRLGPFGDLIMMRKQLLTLKRLAEREAQISDAPVGGERGAV
jgi:hypothetical protein